MHAIVMLWLYLVSGLSPSGENTLDGHRQFGEVADFKSLWPLGMFMISNIA